MADGDPRRGPRVVLALYGLFGLPTLWSLLGERRWLFMANYLPYHRAAEAVLAGEDLYAVTHPDAPGFHFLYPPAVSLAWLPSTLGPPAVGYALQTAVSVALGLAIAVVTWRLVEERGVALARVDRGLLGVAAVGSSVALPTLFFGNVNVILAGLLAVGVWSHHRGRPVVAGVAFGVPGLVKAFPALFGLWLVRVRDWRATAAWMATGAGGLAVGLVVFGASTTRTWVDEVLLPRTEPGLFADGLPAEAGYVSLRQPLGLLLGSDGVWLSVLVVLAVLPVVAVLVHRVDDLEGRLLALLGVTAGTLLVLPSFYVYLVLVLPALFPLAYLLRGGLVRPLFLTGMALVAVTLTPANVALVAPAGSSVAVDLLVGALTVARPPLLGLVLVLVAGVLAVARREGWAAGDLPGRHTFGAE